MVPSTNGHKDVAILLKGDSCEYRELLIKVGKERVRISSFVRAPLDCYEDPIDLTPYVLGTYSSPSKGEGVAVIGVYEGASPQGDVLYCNEGIFPDYKVRARRVASNFKLKQGHRRASPILMRSFPEPDD